MTANVVGSSETFAGLQASAHGVRASIAGPSGSISDDRFPMTIDGLQQLAAWLQRGRVRKAALAQGSLTWPWQAEKARRRSIPGPLNLAYWLEYQGPQALESVADEAAWQPVMLALRDQFTLFVVRSRSVGGPYAIPSDRNAAPALARMLADGDFIAEYPKQALDRVIAELAGCGAAAVEECLSFFAAESRGYWHNRARAKIARRLKHCELSPAQRQRLVRVIAQRLVEGRFTEQFKDQLHLMLQLDVQAASQASRLARQSPLAHVQRYGEWLAARAEEQA